MEKIYIKSGPMASLIRQNYHEECETLINKLINLELRSSYVYLSMSNYFDRDDVALPGMKHFCEEASEVKNANAQKFMKCQVERGGKTVMQHIEAPPTGKEWHTALEGLSEALGMEKKLNQAYLDLHQKASSKRDPHICELIEDEFLDQEVNAIKKLGGLITRLKRAGLTGLGEYIFDGNLSS